VRSTRARATTDELYSSVEQPKSRPLAAIQTPLALGDETVRRAAASPARVLQAEISARWAEDTIDPRWSRRATLLFIAGTCTAFWGLAFWAVYSAVRN